MVGHVPHQEELANIMNCSISSLPLKYMGLPLGASFNSKAIWDGVVEKMERRLASWKKLGSRRPSNPCQEHAFQFTYVLLVPF